MAPGRTLSRAALLLSVPVLDALVAVGLLETLEVYPSARVLDLVPAGHLRAALSSMLLVLVGISLRLLGRRRTGLVTALGGAALLATGLVAEVLALYLVLPLSLLVVLGSVAVDLTTALRRSGRVA